MLNSTVICFVDLNSPAQELNEPYALELLKGQLLSHFGESVSVMLMSTSMNSINEIYDVAFGADVLAFSLNNADTSLVNKIIACDGSPDRLILFGGIYPTIGYKAILNQFQDSVVVLGEGEKSIVEVLSCYMANRAEYRNDMIANDVHGVVFNCNGKLYHSEPKVIDLAAVAHPSRDFIIQHKGKFSGIARIEASRGCSWGKCVFCGIKNRFCDSEKRVFSVNYVVDEIYKLNNLGIYKAFFNDEDFLDVEVPHLLTLLNGIIHANCSIEFFISTSVASILNLEKKNMLKEVFNLMLLAGIKDVFLGVESGCATQLNRYNKGVSVAANEKAMSLVVGGGFKLDVGYILFDPYVTKTELLANIEFIERMQNFGVDSRVLKKMLIIPGTEIHNKLISNGLLESETDANSMYVGYNFYNPDIEHICNEYETYENKGKVSVGKFQSIIRLEKNPQKRIQYSKLLIDIRNIDLCVLKNIVYGNLDRTVLFKNKKKEMLHRIDELVCLTINVT
ncbi:MAG: hypothetical protein Q7U54_11335 [Bacteroidales bacterium]|nr:hypothetical protein [Bacteroidales bacterium]